jgi:hypothetical protein
MPLHREGIESVRVFALPDSAAADGRCATVSGAMLVTWNSSHMEMLHQVYVDGQLAGVTIDTEQRSLVVATSSSFQSAVRVEVAAVEPQEAHVDFSNELERPTVGRGRIRLTLLRSQALPAGARATLYSDNGTLQIDYAKPLHALPVLLWPCLQDKAGFGTAQFGTGDFGYDSAAAVGFGKGSFGHGQFGLDADTVEWISPPLALGRYRFGVKVIDADGNESLASETEPIPVIPAATPAVGLEVATFDPETDQLTLRIVDQA